MVVRGALPPLFNRDGSAPSRTREPASRAAPPRRLSNYVRLVVERAHPSRSWLTPASILAPFRRAFRCLYKELARSWVPKHIRNCFAPLHVANAPNGVRLSTRVSRCQFIYFTPPSLHKPSPTPLRYFGIFNLSHKERFQTFFISPRRDMPQRNNRHPVYEAS